MTSEKIQKLLMTYDFEVEGGIPQNLTCELCKNLLINACQSRCGCRFCSKCIMDYVNKGNIFCPGSTSECKEENLSICSNIHTDYRVNRKLSKLRVKCPEETCKVFCELMDMDEHLRLCTMKNINCPFFVLGCNQQKMVTQDLNVHLQNGNYHHNKLIIDIISNLRNDVFGLLRKEIELRPEIELLKDNIKSQIENITSLNFEIEILKMENIEYKKQFEHFKSEMEDKIEKLFEKIKLVHTKIKEECIENMNIELSKVRGEFRTFQVNVALKLQEIKLYLKRKIDETSGIFSWNVNEISIKRKENQSIFSEYFYTKVNKHKISLQFSANGSNDAIGIGCSIFLFIYSDIQDSKLIWPFQANVTIKIVNKSLPDSCKTMTKYFKIDKPPNNYNWSDPFYFYYDELSTAGLLYDDSFTIECFVDEI